jgi:hypothetical protein
MDMILMKMMKIQKIHNPDIYFENCDIISNYHNIQIFKSFLLVLSELGIRLNEKMFKKSNSEEQIKFKINKMIDYFLAEGLIIEDPDTKKIRVITDDDFQEQIERAYNE